MSEETVALILVGVLQTAVGLYCGWMFWGRKARVYNLAMNGDVLCSFCMRVIPDYDEGRGCPCPGAVASREEFLGRRPVLANAAKREHLWIENKG